MSKEDGQNYNMNSKNNRGVAIQYLLDTIPSLRYLSSSATPITNSPTEVVEWLNYLQPDNIKKSDLFQGKNLRPGALRQIAQLSLGRVSFLKDASPEYFPSYSFQGSPYEVKMRFSTTLRAQSYLI